MQQMHMTQSIGKAGITQCALTVWELVCDTNLSNYRFDYVATNRYTLKHLAGSKRTFASSTI